MKRFRKSSRLDPLVHLNQDVIHEIFLYLDIPDLVSLERVSKGWHQYIKEWMTRFGTRKMLRPVWDPPQLTSLPSRLEYEMIKQHARQIHCMQTGRVLSGQKVEDTTLLCIAGRFIAWVPYPPALIHYSGWLDNWTQAEAAVDLGVPPSDRIHWQVLSKDDAGIRETVHSISASQFLRPDGYVVAVKGMMLNSDGILLVHVGVVPKGERLTVYSLPERRVLWHLDARPGSVGEVLPYRLGPSRVYTATWDPNVRRHKLQAYDLRTGKLLYTTDVLGDEWFRGVQIMHSQGPSCDFKKLLPLAHGHELIMQQSISTNPDTAVLERWIYTNIDIIDATTGQLIQRIEQRPNSSPQQVLSHPQTNQIAIVNRHVVPHEHHQLLYTIERFTYNPHGIITPLYTDAVAIPISEGEVYTMDQSPALFHPFHQAVYTPMLGHGESHEFATGLRTIQTHRLVPMEEGAELYKAKTTLMQLSPQPAEAPATRIREFYTIAGSGTRTALPPAKASSRYRQRRRDLRVSWYIRGRVTGEAQVVFNHRRNYYILDFD